MAGRGACLAVTGRGRAWRWRAGGHGGVCVGGGACWLAPAREGGLQQQQQPGRPPRRAWLGCAPQSRPCCPALCCRVHRPVGKDGWVNGARHAGAVVGRARGFSASVGLQLGWRENRAGGLAAVVATAARGGAVGQLRVALQLTALFAPLCGYRGGQNAPQEGRGGCGSAVVRGVAAPRPFRLLARCGLE